MYPSHTRARNHIGDSMKTFKGYRIQPFDDFEIKHGWVEEKSKFVLRKHGWVFKTYAMYYLPEPKENHETGTFRFAFYRFNLGEV